MIFVGDLSKADVKILSKYAEGATSILEFGVGGSTQIMLQASSAPVVSVDTSQQWINITKDNIKQLGIRDEVKFLLYKDRQSVFAENKYDLIFNDGDPEFRAEFGLESWDSLKAGGFILFHDTRKSCHMKRARSLIWPHELEYVLINPEHSNITVLRKKENEQYSNWHQDENKPGWMWSNPGAPRPKNWVQILKRAAGE